MNLRKRGADRLTAGVVGVLTGLAVVGLPAYADVSTTKPGLDAEPTPTATGTPEPTNTATVPAPTESAPSTPPTSSPAEDPKPWADLSVSAPGSNVAVGSDGKWISIRVDNNEGDKAENVRLTLRTSNLSDSVEVRLPEEDQYCEVDGDTSVCQYPEGLEPQETDAVVAFQVVPKDGAGLGPVGVVDLSVTSDTPDPKLENNHAENQA